MSQTLAFIATTTRGTKSLAAMLSRPPSYKQLTNVFLKPLVAAIVVKFNQLVLSEWIKFHFTNDYS